MKNTIPKIEEINGKLVALFLFQYSLLIPLMRFVSSALLVGCSSLLLLALLVLYNRDHLYFNGRIVVLDCILLTVLVMKVIEGSEPRVVLCFIIYALPASVIMMVPFDEEVFLLAGCDLAILNLLIVAPYPFTMDYNYMRFGFGMLPSLIFLTLKLTNLVDCTCFTRWSNKRSAFDAVVLLAGLAEVAFYGNRGALFAYLLFFVIDRFFINRKQILLNLSVVVVCILLGIFILPILTWLNGIAAKYGMFGRTFYQMIRFFNKGFNEASAGRSILYRKAIERFVERPVFGNKIITDTDKLDYAHNIFLQVGQDLGIVGLTALMVLIIAVVHKLVSQKTAKATKMILAALFGISFGRLMFSSSLWLRPEFWLLTFYCVGMPKHRYQSKLLNSNCVSEQ